MHIEGAVLNVTPLFQEIHPSPPRVGRFDTHLMHLEGHCPQSAKRRRVRVHGAQHQLGIGHCLWVWVMLNCERTRLHGGCHAVFWRNGVAVRVVHALERHSTLIPQLRKRTAHVSFRKQICRENNRPRSRSMAQEQDCSCSCRPGVLRKSLLACMHVFTTY